MLAGAGFDFLDKNAPVLQRGFGMIVRAEIIEQLALPCLEQLPVRLAHHNGPGFVALDRFMALAHVALIGIVRDRRAFAFAGSFDLGHRPGPLIYARYSGASSSCSKPEPRSTEV